MEEDTTKIWYTTRTVFIQGPSIVLPVWRCIMFNGSYLRACMKLWIVQKIRFSLLSLGGRSHGARVWCLGRVPKDRNQWQELEVLLSCPQNSQLVHILSFCWCIFWAFIPRVWFPYSSFQQVRQPSIPSPVEDDTSKIWYTTGTVFIQGPSIVLPVWRSIMVNGSYLSACMKLWIVQKIRFCLLESRWTKPWCPCLVSRTSAKA